MLKFIADLSEEPKKIPRTVLTFLKIIIILILTKTIFNIDINWEDILKGELEKLPKVEDLLIFISLFILLWKVLWEYVISILEIIHTSFTLKTQEEALRVFRILSFVKKGSNADTYLPDKRFQLFFSKYNMKEVSYFNKSFRSSMNGDMGTEILIISLFLLVFSILNGYIDLISWQFFIFTICLIYLYLNILYQSRLLNYLITNGENMAKFFRLIGLMNVILDRFRTDGIIQHKYKLENHHRNTIAYTRKGDVSMDIPDRIKFIFKLDKHLNVVQFETIVNSINTRKVSSDLIVIVIDQNVNDDIKSEILQNDNIAIIYMEDRSQLNSGLDELISRIVKSWFKRSASEVLE